MTTKMIYKPGFAVILGGLLLQFSQSALAFTLIELPDPSTTPSNQITDSTTFKNRIRPLTDAIQSHIHDTRRLRRPGSSAQQDNVLASNTYAGTLRDADFIQLSSHNSSSDLKGLWLNSSFSSFGNDFSRTRYDGKSQLLMIGFDNTKNDRYIFGAAISLETSLTDTKFNLGSQETDGYSLNPYFAYLISDAWSLDLGLGFGSADTDQRRSIVGTGVIPTSLAGSVTSDYSTDREFLTSNLTYSAPRGNWYLSGWLGLLYATTSQDDYTESDGTDVDNEDLDYKRWNLGGEAAYSYGASESYFSLIYEKDTDINEVKFIVGEQPANDDDSLLVAIGWRYFGSDLVASVDFSSRQGAEDETESSISTSLRIDL